MFSCTFHLAGGRLLFFVFYGVLFSSCLPADTHTYTRSTDYSHVTPRSCSGWLVLYLFVWSPSFSLCSCSLSLSSFSFSLCSCSLSFSSFRRRTLGVRGVGVDYDWDSK